MYKGVEAFSEVLYGVLQKNEKLDLVGKSLFCKSLLSVILFIVIDAITKNLVISISAMVILSIIITIIYDLKNAGAYVIFAEKVKFENVMKIFKYGFYTFAIAFLGVYLLNAPKYAIDAYLANNYQTIFGIIVMPATVIGLVAQFLIHPYLNKILELYENRKLKELKGIINKLILAIVGFGAISSLLAYFLGSEVLGLIYGIDLVAYRVQLLIIIIAATIYTIGVIYSSVLTTVRETKSQFVIYIILSIFAMIISNFLTQIGQISGAVWAYLAIMAMQFLIYTIYTNFKLEKIFSKES